jgi:hypothetical protein
VIELLGQPPEVSADLMVTALDVADLVTQQRGQLGLVAQVGEQPARDMNESPG